MAGRGSSSRASGCSGSTSRTTTRCSRAKLLRAAVEQVPGRCTAATTARRLPAARAGPAAGLGRGRREPASRPCGPGCSGCRWRWRSSAAIPSASRRSPSCTAGPRPRAATTTGRCRSTRTASSPRLARRRCGRQFPAFKAMMDRIGRERGWPPLTPRAVPGLARAARRELRRQPGPDRREDPVPARDLQARPVPAADERRHAAARRRDAGDRAARDRGGAEGPRARQRPSWDRPIDFEHPGCGADGQATLQAAKR